jgi:hypothetical protein
MLGNQEKDKNELIASKAKLKVKELGKEKKRAIFVLYSCDFLLGMLVLLFGVPYHCHSVLPYGGVLIGARALPDI